MSKDLRRSILGIWLLAAAGLAAAQDPRRMFAAASALTKLSSSVEATVLFRNPSPTLTDGELLRLSTADNPDLLLQPYDLLEVMPLLAELYHPGETRGLLLQAGNNVGYSGVTVHSPEGNLLGRIRLPEVCANLTFGGPKRNRLFMAASQSLYALYVNTQGTAPG